MLDRYGKTICLDHQKTYQLLLDEYPDRPPEPRCAVARQ